MRGFRNYDDEPPARQDNNDYKFGRGQQKKMEIKKSIYLQTHAKNYSPDTVKRFRNDTKIKVTADRIDLFDPFITWEDTPFNKEIRGVIKSQPWPQPTAIQAQIFPIVLSGHDLIGIAETGSGKTLAFLAPGIMHIKAQGIDRRQGPTMLILAPTRELALQINEQAGLFVRCDIESVCCYGGSSTVDQKRKIQRGVDIVVATPGRLIDLIEQDALSLKHVTFFVIDEADRMLDMGFESQVRRISQDIRPDRQTCYFSATWPTDVRELARELCKEDPIQVQVGGKNRSINASITQFVTVLPNKASKKKELYYILDKLTDSDKVLIFAKTKIDCENLAQELTRNEYTCQAVHGDKTQNERERIIAQFRSSECRLVVATDVLQRGLDVRDITHVINYDLPNCLDDYVHRIGRTGRAGDLGVAITFIDEQMDNSSFASDLIKYLEEAEQQVGEELVAFAESNHFGTSQYRNNRGRGRGGAIRGGQDRNYDSRNAIRGGDQRGGGFRDGRGKYANQGRNDGRDNNDFQRRFDDGGQRNNYPGRGNYNDRQNNDRQQDDRRRVMRDDNPRGGFGGFNRFDDGPQNFNRGGPDRGFGGYGGQRGGYGDREFQGNGQRGGRDFDRGQDFNRTGYAQRNFDEGRGRGDDRNGERRNNDRKFDQPRGGPQNDDWRNQVRGERGQDGRGDRGERGDRGFGGDQNYRGDRDNGRGQDGRGFGRGDRDGFGRNERDDFRGQRGDRDDGRNFGRDDGRGPRGDRDDGRAFGRGDRDEGRGQRDNGRGFGRNDRDDYRGQRGDRGERGDRNDGRSFGRGDRDDVRGAEREVKNRYQDDDIRDFDKSERSKYAEEPKSEISESTSRRRVIDEDVDIVPPSNQNRNEAKYDEKDDSRQRPENPPRKSIQDDEAEHYKRRSAADDEEKPRARQYNTQQQQGRVSGDDDLPKRRYHDDSNDVQRSRYQNDDETVESQGSKSRYRDDNDDDVPRRRVDEPRNRFQDQDQDEAPSRRKQLDDDSPSDRYGSKSRAEEEKLDRSQRQKQKFEDSEFDGEINELEK